MMYKSKPAVTLIETLISLTIVGIALIALLPVVTVKKASTVTDYGNMYWDNSNDMNGTKYLCPASSIPDKKVSIGAGDTEPIKAAALNVNGRSGAVDTKFTIFNQGLGNSENFPLTVNERLTWNGTTIRSLGQNQLHIGSNPKGDIENTIAYNNNLYINSADGGHTFILEQNDSKSPLLKETSLGYNTTDIQNLSTIRVDDNEYMHVSAYTGPPAYTYIGIGKNAVKNNTKNNDIIAIANAYDNFTFSDNCAVSRNDGGEPTVATDNCLNTDLVIGAKHFEPSGTTTNYYNIPTDWVIHHHPTVGANTSMFTINAPVVSFPSITVAKVVLPSDRRLKTILSQYKKGLKELLKINPVEFVYKKDENKEHHIGVIAQDLRKVFPEAVEKNPQTGYLMVGTDPIFYAMINAIKELHMKNQELKKQNDELEQKVIKLRKIRDELKASQGGAV